MQRTLTSHKGFVHSMIFLSSLSLLNCCRLFPQRKITATVRTAVGVFIISVRTTCPSDRENGSSSCRCIRLQNPLISFKTRNVTYAVCSNPSGQDTVLHRRPGCWRRRLLNHRRHLFSCSFVLGTAFFLCPIFQWLQEIMGFEVISCSHINKTKECHSELQKGGNEQ